jgi:DNA-binding transcriptional MocR family regulator
MLDMSTNDSQLAHKTWRYEQVAESVARLIERGTFRPGERIPSVRQLSRQQKVSLTTALQACRLLEDQGLIEAHPQSGYFVRSHPAIAPLELDISSPARDPAHVSVHELVMMLLRDSRNPDLVQFGAALPNPDLLPTKKLNRMLSALARQAGDENRLYDIPPGCEALRIQIAQRAVLAGCQLAPADIVTTSGCSEAISLSLRAICRPGDTVAVESPTYFGVLQVMESLGLRALEIPTHPQHGISLEALRFAIEHNPVRACVVLSNFNNPLGSCMPDEHKRELAELLADWDIALIEDDASGEIYFGEQRPTVAKAYDRKGLVLLCSSFSKDLSPSFRVGWIVPGRFKSEIEQLKFTTNIATATLPQLAIAQFLASGGYDHHLRRIRRIYASQVNLMSQAVMRYFPEGTRVTRPAGGHVLWVQLPEDVDSLALYTRALEAGITLAPGYLFSATEKYCNFIRLNAAYWSLKAERAMERLGEIMAGMVG